MFYSPTLGIQVNKALFLARLFQQLHKITFGLKLIGFGYPCFYLGPRCAIRHVLERCSAQILRVISHPFVFGSGWILIWGEIGFVMQPTVPIGWNLAAVVVEPFKLWENVELIAFIGDCTYNTVARIPPSGFCRKSNNCFQSICCRICLRLLRRQFLIRPVCAEAKCQKSLKRLCNIFIT